MELRQQTAYFLIAAWAAVVFGLLEALALQACRAFPALLAPYKSPIETLWIAPLLDLALFAAAALALRVAGGRWLRAAHVHGVFFFLGVFTVLWAPKVLHPAAVAILSLGAASVYMRSIEARLDGWNRWLERRAAVLPVLILAAAAGATAYPALEENRQARTLSAPQAGAPNVLVVVLDTVRASIPEGEGLTPRLDGLAARGARYTNAWSMSSWSLPGHASIMTGRSPHEHGADWPRFGLRASTMAEQARRRGYATAAFSGNSAWVTPDYLGLGSLRFHVYSLEDALRRTVWGRLLDRISWEFGSNRAGRGRKAPDLLPEFYRFLDDYPGRPFFAYLCFMDVNQAFNHTKFNRGFWQRPASTGEIVSSYRAGLKTLDAQVGGMLDELARRGLMENTVIVVTSDHGQSFGAANPGDHDPYGHGTSLYAEQTRVPMVVYYPKAVPGGVYGEPVSTRQIAPVVARLAGWKDTPFDSPPLPGAGEGGASRPVLSTLNYLDQPVRAVVAGGLQYIRNYKRQPAEELFDLAADPGTRTNLAPGHAAMGRVRAALDAETRGEAPPR